MVMAPIALVKNQITKLCAQEETKRYALELYNLAVVKTGPGTGHELGKMVNALGPVCALLASEKLGNNDVFEKVAQDVSCLKPQDFKSALSVVRTALSDYLKKKERKSASYRDLCRDFRFNDDALYWMEEVDKEVRKSGDLNELDVDEDCVVYMVFYWTCIALNMRSVKRATIITDFGVDLHDFQDIEYVLDASCQKLKESIDKFVSEARLARAQRTGAVPPAKAIRESTTPRKLAGETAPLKRKVVLPPLPFMTPTKRSKMSTSTPTRLNRLPVASTATSPPKSPTKTPIAGMSPVKTYGTSGTFIEPPSKRKAALSDEEEEQGREPELERSPKKRLTFAELPETPSKSRILKTIRRSSSPRKIHETSVPLTPTPRRLPATQKYDSLSSARRLSGKIDIMETSDVEDGLTAVVVETEPLCRHQVPTFSDRLFYHYRDPRNLREWEESEANMKEMIRKFGDALGQIVAY